MAACDTCRCRTRWRRSTDRSRSTLGGIRVDDLTARLGEGEVRFGGRVAMNGFAPGELSLTANGEQMRVRYPEGFRSLVDADLWLRGSAASPILGGVVTVRDAIWSKRFEVDPNVFELGGGSPSARRRTGRAHASSPIRHPGQSRRRLCAWKTTSPTSSSSAELKLQGTYDKPLLFGHAEIERGDIVFEGNRYLVTRGSIDFLNPAGRIEPLFDIEAETRVRVPGADVPRDRQRQRHTDRVLADPSSDPPLPEVDIVSLLFGQTTTSTTRNCALCGPKPTREAKEALIRALGAR